MALGYLIFVTTSIFLFSYSQYLLSFFNLNFSEYISIIEMKHFMVILVSLFSIKKIPKLKKEYLILLPLFLTYLLYLFHQYWMVFFQFCVLFFASISIAKIYRHDKVPASIFYLFLFMSLLIPFIDYLFNNSEFIINNIYGRERMLLGYFHPKEAGSVFFILATLFLFSREKKLNLIPNFLIHCFVIGVLLLIQSRNALMLYVLIILGNQFAKRIGVLQFIVLATVLISTIFMLLYELSFDFFDGISSYRLSRWQEMLNVSFFGETLEKLPYENLNFNTKIHFDSFFVEILHEIGIFGLVNLLIGFILIINYIKEVEINGYSSSVILFSFLIYSLFDASVFSTGNLLNLYIWSLVIKSIDLKGHQTNSNVN